MACSDHDVGRALSSPRVGRVQGLHTPPLRCPGQAFLQCFTWNMRLCSNPPRSDRSLAHAQRSGAAHLDRSPETAAPSSMATQTCRPIARAARPPRDAHPQQRRYAVPPVAAEPDPRETGSAPHRTDSRSSSNSIDQARRSLILNRDARRNPAVPTPYVSTHRVGNSRDIRETPESGSAMGSAGRDGTRWRTRSTPATPSLPDRGRARCPTDSATIAVPNARNCGASPMELRHRCASTQDPVPRTSPLSCTTDPPSTQPIRPRPSTGTLGPRSE